MTTESLLNWVVSKVKLIPVGVVPLAQSIAAIAVPVGGTRGSSIPSGVKEIVPAGAALRAVCPKGPGGTAEVSLVQYQFQVLSVPPAAGSCFLK